MLGQSFNRVRYPNIKRLAKTKRYEVRRKQQLDDFPLCQFCEKKGLVVAAELADHVIPHRGDEELFLNGELQSLCWPCHSSRKQSEEAPVLIKGYSNEVGEDGWPVDPNNPVISGKDKSVGRKGIMSHPPWFRASLVPLHIVCGPPAGGKSTFVQANIQEGERLICFDTIASELFGTVAQRSTGLDGKMVGDVLRKRNDMLGDLMWAKAKAKWSAAWLIVSEPTAEGRQWWADRLNPATIYLTLPPERVALDRAKARCLASYRVPGPLLNVVATWYKSYTPREGDVVV